MFKAKALLQTVFESFPLAYLQIYIMYGAPRAHVFEWSMFE